MGETDKNLSINWLFPAGFLFWGFSFALSLWPCHSKSSPAEIPPAYGGGELVFCGVGFSFELFAVENDVQVQSTEGFFLLGEMMMMMMMMMILQSCCKWCDWSGFIGIFPQVSSFQKNPDPRL